eukprot:366072-Chlamydomonas_euryale.AAC.16
MRTCGGSLCALPAERDRDVAGQNVWGGVERRRRVQRFTVHGLLAVHWWCSQFCAPVPRVEARRPVEWREGGREGHRGPVEWREGGRRGRDTGGQSSGGREGGNALVCLSTQPVKNTCGKP